jgi:hypothetical protein
MKLADLGILVQRPDAFLLGLLNCFNDSPPMDKLKPQQPCMHFGAKTWRRFDPAVVQQVLGAPTSGRQQEVVLHTATVIVSFGPSAAREVTLSNDAYPSHC